MPTSPLLLLHTCTLSLPLFPAVCSMVPSLLSLHDIMYTHCCHNRVLTSAAQIPFQGSALKAHNTPYTDGSTLHLSISVMSMTICHLVVIPSQEYRILQIQIRSKVWGTWWTANDWSKIDARVSGHVSSQPNASQFLRVVRLGNYVTKKLFTVPLGKFNFTLYLHFRNRQCPPPNKCVSKVLWSLGTLLFMRWPLFRSTLY